VQPRFRDAVRSLPPRVWVLSFGIMINRAGNFLPVFIVLYLTGRGYSPGAAGLVLGSAGLGNVLGNAVGGYLADRLGRRWTIALSGITAAGLTATVPLLHDLVLIIVVVGLTGAAAQTYRPAASALLVDSVQTNQQRLAAFGVFRLAMNIGASAGGLVGGLLATHSYTELFLGNAAACLLLSVTAVLMLRDAPHPVPVADAAESAENAEPAAKASYRQVLADRRLRRFLLMTVIAEFVYIQSTVGLPLHVTAVGRSAADFGLLIGLNGLLVLVFELPITSLVSKRRMEYVLTIGNLLTGVGLALTGVATSMVWLAGTVLLWTLGEMMYSSVANAYLGGLSKPNMVGRYQGLYGVALTLGTGTGPLLGGVIYALQPWVLWLVVGVVGLWSAQLCLPGRRDPAVPTESTVVVEQEGVT
jgi:MFS family permease